MKDFSRIALLAALVLLVFTLSSADGFSLGHMHFGWLRRLLPLALICWVIWMFRKGGCCCGWRCTPREETETGGNEDIA